MKTLLAFVLVATLLPGAGMAAKGKRAAGCSTTQSGSSLVTTVPLNIHGHRLQLILTTAGTLASGRTSSLLLSQGHRTLLQSHGSFSAGGFAVTIQFSAAAVHGIGSIELTSSDGRTVASTVDGRALAAFVVGSDSTGFVDGGRPPKVKIKPLVRQVLRRLSKIDLSACSAAHSAAASPQPLVVSNCDLCEAGCGLGFMGCGFSALTALAACEIGSAGAATPVCVPAYLAAAAGCEKALSDCSTACTRGSACCPVPCFGGTGVAISDTAVCDQTCSDNAVCCGGPNDPQGECCDHSSNCCGSNCLEGIFAGDRCVNPSTGAFCFKGSPGDVCGDTSHSGFAFCCPSGSPVCRDLARHVCCAQGAGDLCEVDGQPGCCPANAPQCVGGSVCCAPQDICGNAGDCCPPPHLCLGQTCCNPPSTVCGSACCDESSTCVDATSSLCCASLTSVVCGSKCCDGTTQRCVSGECCPRNSACGSVCCPPGETCTNPNTGTCSPCPQGQVACKPMEGSPGICCAQGENCCAGPPAVCCSDPTQQSCCGSPTVQCHSADFCVR